MMLRLTTLFRVQTIAGLAAVLVVLSGGAAGADPGAGTDPRPVLAFRAGEILQLQVRTGDENAARQVAQLFVNSLHVYFDNGQMAIATPDAKEVIAVCQFQVDQAKHAIVFAGQSEKVTVSGLLFVAEDKQPYTVTRVQVTGPAPLDMLFLQRMQALTLNE